MALISVAEFLAVTIQIGMIDRFDPKAGKPKRVNTNQNNNGHCYLLTSNTNVIYLGSSKCDFYREDGSTQYSQAPSIWLIADGL